MPQNALIRSTLFSTKPVVFFATPAFDLGTQVSIVRLSSVRRSICPSVSIYPWCLVRATPLTVLYRLFLNFACVFLHGMGMCMWFGYDCTIIFCRFFHIVNLGTSCERSHFSPSVYRQSVQYLL